MVEFSNDKILDYKNEILKSCEEIIKIKSIVDLDKTTDNEPFGKTCYEALEWIIKKGEELGLKAKICKNHKAGYVEYGEGEDHVAVVTHVDVVPVAKDWDSDPFELIEKDGYYVARGIADNKGAAVISLYCLKALKDSGVLGKHKIRCIFGSGEEAHCEDISAYFQEEPLPIMSFTPDSDYGICNAEKAILRMKVSQKHSEDSIIKSFQAGTVMNAVPDTAKAVIVSVECDFEAIKNNALKCNGNFEFNKTAEGLEIISKGKSCHAMNPEKGFNAAAALVNLLVTSLGENKVGEFCSFVEKYLGFETDGKSLGLKCNDEVSGDMTVNLALMQLNDGIFSFALDMRLPVTVDIKKVQEKAKSIFSTLKNSTVEIINSVEPLYIPADAKLIRVLNDAYKKVMEKDADIYSCGGGTYARQLRRTGVAFGMSFSDNKVHEKNECVKVEEFWLHAQICLQAMHDMMMA